MQMKQILIAKNNRIKKLYGSELELTSDKELSFTKDNLNVAYFDLNISPVSGKGTYSISYKASEEIAQHGVLLVSAFEQDGVVRAYFKALVSDITMPKDTPILIVTLFEPVVYRQVDTTIASAVVQVAPEQSGNAVELTTPDPAPKKRGGRRKKT